METRRRSVRALWPYDKEESRGEMGPEGGGENALFLCWTLLFEFRSADKGGVRHACCFSRFELLGVGGFADALPRPGLTKLK